MHLFGLDDNLVHHNELINECWATRTMNRSN